MLLSRGPGRSEGNIDPSWNCEHEAGKVPRENTVNEGRPQDQRVSCPAVYHDSGMS